MARPLSSAEQDYEALIETSKAMIHVAMIRLMIRRLGAGLMTFETPSKQIGILAISRREKTLAAVTVALVA